MHVEINNNSNDKVSIYSFSFKIIANGKNYEEEYNYNLEHEEIDSDLSPITITSGTIGYKAMDFDSIDSIQVIVEAPFSDNWDVDLTDYIFDMKL